MKVITRDNQEPEVLYIVIGHVWPADYLDSDDYPTTVDEWEDVEEYYFVTPDGEGRFYYDTRREAFEQHGSLPTRQCVIPDEE